MVSQAAGQSSSNTLVPLWTPLSEATLDIIAVHGLNVGGQKTHAEDAWTHEKTRVNWLRSLLPARLPTARILSFEYNANIAFDTSISGVEEQAINLLNCLRLIRKRHPTRPIIFIAHSLGGIIVKEALATAFREHEAYPMIWTFTFAVFFLAVPHKGSSQATWGNSFAGILLAATDQPSNSLLESVALHSDYNEALNARFEPLHAAYRFYSWVEGLPMPPWGMILEKDAATLGLPAVQEICRIAERNHSTICKFSDADDREWMEFSANLAEAAEMATKSFNYTPTMHHRKAMFTTPALQNDEKRNLSLVEAVYEAQSMVNRADRFLQGDELRNKQNEADDATSSLWTLAALLLTVLAPILKLLSGFAGWQLANIALAGALALLPSKEVALEKALKGQEAEERIMVVDEWAIETLNEHLQGVLRASYNLQRAMTSGRLEHPDDADALQLIQVHNMQRQLLDRTERMTNDLHERHKSYNRAEATRNKIEQARKEAAGKDNNEFWIATAEMVQKEKDAQKEAPKDNRGGCPCVIL